MVTGSADVNRGIGIKEHQAQHQWIARRGVFGRPAGAHGRSVTTQIDVQRSIWPSVPPKQHMLEDRPHHYFPSQPKQSSGLIEFPGRRLTGSQQRQYCEGRQHTPTLEAKLLLVMPVVAPTLHKGSPDH
jgi:hypothetical protein